MIVWTAVPRGDQTFGSPDRKRLRTGVPTAAARCEMPESLPTKIRARRSQQASSYRSSIRTAPSSSSSGPHSQWTGIVRQSRCAGSRTPPSARVSPAAGERMNHRERPLRRRARDRRESRGRRPPPVPAPERCRYPPHAVRPWQRGQKPKRQPQFRQLAKLRPRAPYQRTHRIEAAQPLDDVVRRQQSQAGPVPPQPMDCAESAKRASGTFCSAHQTSVYPARSDSRAGRLTINRRWRRAESTNAESNQQPMNHLL